MLGIENWEICDSPDKATITHYWIPVGPDSGRVMRCKYCSISLTDAQKQ